MPYLRCNDTLRQSSTDVPIRKPLVTIGRMPGNDVVLDDQAVGATHANLLRSGDGTTINAVDARRLKSTSMGNGFAPRRW